MIVRPRPPLWKLFFILKGSIVTRILPQIFAVFVLSLVVVWAHRAFPGWVPAFNNGRPLRCWVLRFRSSSAFATMLATTAGGKREKSGVSSYM